MHEIKISFISETFLNYRNILVHLAVRRRRFKVCEDN